MIEPEAGKKKIVTARTTTGPVAVTDNGNGTFSFAMPADDVTITSEQVIMTTVVGAVATTLTEKSAGATDDAGNVMTSAQAAFYNAAVESIGSTDKTSRITIKDDDVVKKIAGKTKIEPTEADLTALQTALPGAMTAEDAKAAVEVGIVTAAAVAAAR